ncbi:MAG TPA: tRNA lysidine(34) synthetase TilS [Bacilli bacterium]
MEKLLVDFFEKNKLKLKDATIVLAVSTGVDSMVMLHSFLKIKDSYHLNLQVAHFNHQKRAQSEIEEKFLKEFCEEQNIGFHTERLTKEVSGNFQSFARTKRYDFFRRVAEKTQADYLALAHHANDNIETILMRIIRGSNLKGYAGMDAVLPFHGFLLIRPFLTITKDELINYALLHKIKYYQDESNFQDVYTRNRIRMDIVPAFFREDNNVHLKFQEFSDTLKAANSLLEEKIAEFSNKIQYEKDYFRFQLDDFLKLNRFLQIEVLFKVLQHYQFSKNNIEEILKLILSEKKNLKVFYKDSLTFVKEYGIIFFYDHYVDSPVFDILIQGPGTYKISDKISVNVIKNESVDIPNSDCLWYNTNMLPLRLRNRRPGDKILLETGYKKVKDLLIDKKIGILEREQAIICEKDNEILAVLGIRKSSKLKEIKNNDIIIKVERNDG